MAVTTKKAPAGLPDGVYYDELGRAVAPLELLVPYQGNPRNEDDFDYDKSAQFRDLANSIDQVGVREPIQVFVLDGKLQMISGHRRVGAIGWVNNKRAQAFGARVEMGSLRATDARPEDLQPIRVIPITIVAPPHTPFDREADMWLAESQRAKWPINRLVPFYKTTFDSAPDAVRNDVSYMARRLGLPPSRVRLLNTVVTSDVLTQAAQSTIDDPLPRAGREKTLRSINRAAEVIAEYRPNAAIRITGRYQVDGKTLEMLRERMIEKAREIDRAPGVALEKIAPQLKYSEKYDDETIVSWATGVGSLPDDRPTAKTSEDGSDREIDNRQGTQQESLLEVVNRYRERDLSQLSQGDLGSLLSELTEAGELIDTFVAAVRTARRSRVA